MSKAIIDEQSLTDIADAIRAKNGSADTYTPSEMATAITDLPSGGGVTIQTETFTPVADVTGGSVLTLQGDFSKVIAIEVYCDKAELAAATKTKNSIFILSCPVLPHSYTGTTSSYTGYTGYWYGYSINNAERNSVAVATRTCRIKNDYSEMIIGAGATSEPVYCGGITYTVKIYRADLP